MPEFYATIDEAEKTAHEDVQALEVRVPASTSNLGAGFDCFGLALRLYVTVRATRLGKGAELCSIRSTGEGSAALTDGAPNMNLIFCAMQLAAERVGLRLPPVRLEVHNEIPLGRGLGSSAAAIVAGLSLCGRLCGAEDLEDELILQLATELEGHPDNVAASLMGGWITACVKADGAVLALKRHWPPGIKLIVVSPEATLNTRLSRAALPPFVDRADAVHNLQRVALLGAALDAHADDLIWEAMQDRLHQAHRQSMVPGLAEALATPRLPGLLGLALSGAGPSVIALARDRHHEIGARISESFAARGVPATIQVLEADTSGRILKKV